MMKRTEPGSPRLLMLGLDSASLPFIRDNLDRLPFMAALLQNGALRNLQSTAGHFSASVWPTFLTGKQPGEHGQYFPFQWSGKHRRYFRIADPRWSEEFGYLPFWHRIANSGIETIAFDVAHVLHDARAPCLQITNWSYQSSGTARASHPEVLEEIRRSFGHRPIGAEVPILKSARQCDALRRRMIAAVRAKADATIFLLERSWQLFVTGWYEVHRAGHNLWPIEGDFASDAAPDALLEVYEETDRQLARVWQHVQGQETETTLLLFSLHGLEPNRAQEHFLTEVLRRLNRIYLGRQLDWTPKPASGNVMAYLRKALPATFQYWAANALGERAQDWVVNRAAVSSFDWEATPSIPVLSGGEGLIRFCIKGREDPGFFEPGSKRLADYSAWLQARLLAIRVTQTGEPLIAKIIDVDDQYPGPRRHLLPDLCVQWAPDAPVDRVTSSDIGEIEISLATGRGGNHNDEAFVLAIGQKINADAFSDLRTIADLGEFAERTLLAW